MPGRHRQPVPPRVLPKRLVAAGASGVVTVLAFAPIAHADTPADDVTTSAAPSSETPSSEAPSSETPTSEAPSSEIPTSDAPSSETPTSDAPSSETPTSDAPSSETPTSDTPSSETPAAPSTGSPSAKRARVALAPDYGRRKITLGDREITLAVQLKAGNYAPDGTAGSVITVHETGPNAPTGPDYACTTTGTPGQALTPCPDTYTVAAGDTAVVTQTSAAPGTVADPAPQSFGLCFGPDSAPPLQISIVVPDCTDPATFTATGLPPTVSDPARTLTVKQDGSVTVGPDSQVDRHGAPATSVDVDQPAHGVVTVNQAAAPLAVTNTPVIRPFTLSYTPAKGYVGPDSFRYRVTTANGTSAYVTVSLRVVGAAPTARNDSATTPEGDAVRVAVLGNDDDNGGGAVSITGVTDPGHGRARVTGSRIVYTPAKNFSGPDSFSYTIESYSGTDTATVTVKVKAADDGNGADGTSDGAGTNSDEASTADTGVPSERLLETGGLLLLAGAGATVVGRRRRRDPA